MAEATVTYEIKQAFWHKQQLQTPGTEAAPNTITLTPREARYHLFAGDIAPVADKVPSQPLQTPIKAASKSTKSTATAPANES